MLGIAASIENVYNFYGNKND